MRQLIVILAVLVVGGFLAGCVEIDRTTTVVDIPPVEEWEVIEEVVDEPVSGGIAPYVVDVLPVEPTEYDIAYERLEEVLESYNQGYEYSIEKEHVCLDMALATATRLQKSVGYAWNVQIARGQMTIFDEPHAWVIVDYRKDRHMDWIAIECTANPTEVLGVIVVENMYEFPHLPANGRWVSVVDLENYEPKYGVHYRINLEVYMAIVQTYGWRE